jgi:hypothetical protein
MVDLIRELLVPYYVFIKFIHVLFVMMWAWSAMLAFSNYLVPAFRGWRLNPGDEQRLKMRNWAMERFDEGVIYEHVAFTVVLITGSLLYICGSWSTAANWLLLKLSIVVVIMIPIEIFDCYISHFGGNKARIRQAGNSASYETMVHRHWWFLLITTPVIAVFVMTMLFLALVKPF